ncbi:hypothetical protein [Planomonospora venezuelensis]|uniref:FXSXX-COOH protein n=1 Tax=Planomonospora venezuelensis TaxID=1999 RepID=A0A841D3S4_PLAVE|nr:hypothetical protein [Planomonospora venezuelensis]MBB5963603.1 hypothetical protein [Planomonospora venezuelensis]GIN01391.1 hypothetical protein Pve01_30490 [Planomonospora venezuelensis]
MEDDHATGLIDFSDLSLEKMKALNNSKVREAVLRIAGEDGGVVAGFQSAL